MLIGGSNKSLSFVLTEDETKRLNQGETIERVQGYSRGIVSFKLVREVICPSLPARQFFKDLLSEKEETLRSLYKSIKNNGIDIQKITVSQLHKIMQKEIHTTNHRLLLVDLDRLENNGYGDAVVSNLE